MPTLLLTVLQPSLHTRAATTEWGGLILLLRTVLPPARRHEHNEKLRLATTSLQIDSLVADKIGIGHPINA